MPTPTFAASAEDSIAITVSDIHRQTLRNAFTSVSAAENYNAIEHTVDIASGTRLLLGVEGVKNKGDYSVLWETTNSDVVQVTQTGEVLALNVGTAKIKITSGTLMSEIVVNVHNAIEIKYPSTNITLNKLCNFSLNAEGDLSKYLYSVDWVISDKTYALCGDGLVLAKKVGTCKITASIKSRIDGHLVNTSISTINILEPTTSVVVENPISSIELGSEYRFSTTTVPEKQNIIWEAKDPGIIKFDKGVMKAVGVGKTIVYAYAGCWKNNEYVKDVSTFYSFEVQVWSSSTVKYNITAPDDANVTVSKNAAVANETVTIQTSNVVTKKLGSVTVQGVSTVSVEDASGMIVPVTKVSANVYTFTMPKSEVTIKTTYSTLYQVTYDTGTAINFARNDNAIAFITVNEYVPGSFAGDFEFSVEGVAISKIVSEYGSMVSVGTDSVIYNVNPHRGYPGSFDIVVYADSQNANAGTYSVDITGPVNFVITNAFTATHTNNVNPAAIQVSLDYIQSKPVANRLISLDASEQMVIHGEAMQYIMSMNLGLEIHFKDGSLTIPASSLKNLSVSAGDFTLFELKVVKDTFGAEGVYGNGSLTVKTFKPAGSVLDQISMISNATITLNAPDGEKLSIQTAYKTFEGAANKFELTSLSRMSSFTILMQESLIDGNVIFVVIVSILIAALAVAAWFLVKRLKTQTLNNDDPTDPETDPTNSSDEDDDDVVELPPIEDDLDDAEDINDVANDTTEDDVEDAVPVVLNHSTDAAAFKSVNDILKESKLEKEVDYIKVDAQEELKNEIAREISISGICENVLMSENQKEELINSLIAFNLYDGSNIDFVHDNFKSTLNKANKCRENSVETLRNEDASVAEIHAQTDELRLLNSSLSKLKEEYENLNKKLSDDIDAIYERIERLQDGKKVLINKLDLATEKQDAYVERIKQLNDVFATANELNVQNRDDYGRAKQVLDNALAHADASGTFLKQSKAFADAINGETSVEILENTIAHMSDIMGDFDFDALTDAEFALNNIIADARAAIEIENQKMAELKEQLLFAIDTLNDVSSNAHAQVNSFKQNNVDEEAATELDRMVDAMKFVVNDNLNTVGDIKNEVDRLLAHQAVCMNIIANIATYIEEYNARKLQAEAEAKRIAEEEAARIAAEAETKRIAEEEAARIAAEAEAKRLAEEEAARIAAEEEAKRLAEEEAARVAAEAEAKRLAEEEAARVAAEEEAKRLAEEEATRVAAEAEAKRIAEEEVANVNNMSEDIEEVTEAINPIVIDTPVYATAEEADKLLTDKQAEDSVRVVKMKNKATGKIMPVNIGDICEHFNEGEVVNLQSLKEKRLISKNAERVKVLARGVMTKKLQITAHKFSLQAIKMIVLAGGTVSMED